MSEYTTEDLIREFKSGNIKAFNYIIKNEENFIKKLLYIFLKGNNYYFDDLMQEILISIFYSLKNFNFNSNFRTYLYKLVKNKTIDFIRKNKRKKRGDERFLKFSEMGFEKSIEDKLLEKENKNEILKLLFFLNEEERNLIFLKDIEGFSLKDISTITGLKIGTLKTKLHRARLKLYKIYKRDFL